MTSDFEGRCQIDPFTTIQRDELIARAEQAGHSLFDEELDCLRRNLIPLKYIKTVNAIGVQNTIQLRLSSVLILGCGGVGDYVCECLARIGVGRLKVVDGDVFTESNLNRQLYCYEDNLGSPKAVETAKALQRINSANSILAINEFIHGDSCKTIIENSDLVIDALDRIEDRLPISSECAKLNIPYVFGNIGSYSYRISVQGAGEQLLERLYSQVNEVDIHEGAPVISAAYCGVAMAAEAVKYLCKMDDVLISQIFDVCWTNFDSTRLDMSLQIP